jgi:hypothetical protein
VRPVVTLYRCRWEPPHTGRNAHHVRPWNYGCVGPDGSNRGLEWTTLPLARRGVRERYGRGATIECLWLADAPRPTHCRERRWLVAKSIADIGRPALDWRGPSRELTRGEVNR